MRPHRVRAITVRILSQFRHDRRTLALLFVAPLVIISLLFFLLRGGGSKPAVGVVNLDSGPLGSTIAARLESSPLVSATAMDRATADKQLHDGSLTGYILFPADFTDRALTQHELRPEIHLEGSQPGPSQQRLQAVRQAIVAPITARPVQAGRPP